MTHANNMAMKVRARRLKCDVARCEHRAGCLSMWMAAKPSVQVHGMHLVPLCRLDAEKLNERHYSETSCREFRRSVLAALPHTWGDRRDTRLQEAVFVRHKEGVGQQREGLAARAQHKASLASGGWRLCWWGCVLWAGVSWRGREGQGEQEGRLHHNLCVCQVQTKCLTATAGTVAYAVRVAVHEM
jgi:hypothetical protein